MHRQGQGAQTLRVRRQGQRRYHAASLTRRPVRRSCRIAARQSLRWPHARQGHPGDGNARRQRHRTHHHRCRLSRPQRARPNTSSRSSPPARSAVSPRRSSDEMRRRAAVEPVIGHLKAEHRMGRNHLAHPVGDAINAVLAAAGYNFRRLLQWLRLLLLRILIALGRSLSSKLPEIRVLHGRLGSLFASGPCPRWGSTRPWATSVQRPDHPEKRPCSGHSGSAGSCRYCCKTILSARASKFDSRSSPDAQH